MSIKRITSTKDNTISTAFKSNLSDRATAANMGGSDILEIFSIYGHASSASLERSRILVDFPASEIYSMRTSGEIPESGSATFIVKLFNAEHGQTTPSGYTVSAHPIVRSWNEGDGLDMESYLDKGSSNWYSASSGNEWHTYGGDIATSSYIDVSNSPIPLNYDCVFDTGFENFEVDITPLAEEWIKTLADEDVNASGSIELLENPVNDETITVYGYNGKAYNIIIATSSARVGANIYVERGASKEDTASNIKTQLDSEIGSIFTTTVTDAVISLEQASGGLYGNTIISASFDETTGSVTNFAGGVGATPYGLLFKLSGSYETGGQQTSYYTKKYFARSSHHQLERPIIEVQWDPSVQDDRANFFRSSSLATAEENLGNIYLYNRRRTGYMDIPDTGSALVVQLVDDLGGSVVDIAGANVSDNYITASKVSTGIYKASFAYAGSETTLRDVWKKDVFTEASAAGVAASASVSFSSIPLDGEAFTLIDTSNVSASFVVVGGVSTNDGSQNESGQFIVGRSALADIDAFVTRLSEVITAQTASAISSTTSGTTLSLVQDVTGSDGNTTIDLSDFTGASLSEGTGFQGGFTFVPAYHTYTELYSGSYITIREESPVSYYETPQYVTNITNLKPSYAKDEQATFRLYTRNKNWKPNLYTVARDAAPVDILTDAYYKVVRASDNFVVINYSTGSTPSYSSLSYDASGSYFDLDMSILEPNYLYEISILRKYENDYIEQKEKFKFRVEP
jgi:hypothetical protein